MKILVFTHKSDIDGMGSVILSKLAFHEVEYLLCETFNLKEEITKYYENGRIYQYDRIFVTDLWLEEEILAKIAKDKILKNKFFLFDHHESAIEEIKNEYSFVTLKIADGNGLCSGTSLFYEYLIKENLIDRKDQAIKEFVELTRRYDTWEWKTKYKNELAHQLTLLFDSIGGEGYIQLMYQKLSQSLKNKFEFDELETMLICNKINQVQGKIESYAKKIHYQEILGLRAGIVFIDYEYRNDLAEYFREHSYDIDFVMLIALDYGVISYRSMKENINVRLIAKAMGGKGHNSAASSPISSEKMGMLIKILSEPKND